MNEDHKEQRGEKKQRVEGWFTPHQMLWLKTLSTAEDRSQSSILRAALKLYVRQRVEQVRTKDA